MLSSTPHLRPLSGLATRLHPTPTLSCTHRQTLALLSKPRIHTISHPAPACPLRRPTPHPTRRLRPAQARAASTSTASPFSTGTSPGTAAAASSAASAAPLTWNRFLALRKTRRRISVVSSAILAVACLGGGMVVVQSTDIDSWGAQTLGWDPFVIMGLTTFACGAAGWLIGPFFGNALFGGIYRGLRPQIAAKENEFFARIRKHRVDPSSSSIQNPVPDYYGEKIGSVADYRRWLKDQRAFNLKREKALL